MIPKATPSMVLPWISTVLFKNKESGLNFGNFFFNALKEVESLQGPPEWL